MCCPSLAAPFRSVPRAFAPVDRASPGALREGAGGPKKPRGAPGGPGKPREVSGGPRRPRAHAQRRVCNIDTGSHSNSVTVRFAPRPPI
eukprot:1907241-Pyramimonas_sp.AAC.1